MKLLALDIPFPQLGMNKQVGFNDQPYLSTVDAVNVRLWSVGASVSATTAERRMRGGSRPGTGKAYPQNFGGAVRLLDTLTLARQTFVNKFRDDFANTRTVSGVIRLLAYWTQASWLTYSPRPYPDDQTLLVFEQTAGVVRDAITYDSAQPYAIRLGIEPYNSAHNGTYQIFARMNATTPVVTTNGISAELILNGSLGTYSGNLKVYVASVLTTYPFAAGSLTPATAQAGEFVVLINGDNVKAYWKDVALIDQNIATQTGTRFGFGMDATVSGGVCLVDYFEFSYIRGDRRAYENPLRVVTSANNNFFVEDDSFTAMVQVATTTSLAADRQLQATELNGNLYIADYSAIKAQGTDGILDDTGKLLTSNVIADFVAAGVDATTDVVVLFEVQGDAVAGTYRISQVTAERVELVRSATTGSGGTAFFRIERAPKRYIGADDTLEIWQSDAVDPDADPVVYKGEVPTGNPLITTYRGRIVMAGGSSAPNVWYMSRQEDPDDWDYGVVGDTRAAVAGATASAGQIGDPIKALVPHSDDYLVFGCAAQLWVLRGDPAFGGEMANLSRTVGIGWQKSWCYGPSGEIIFMSYDGIYVLAPGANSYPVAISRERLPDAFDIPDQNRDDYEVLMEYDVPCSGVHIYIIKTDGTAVAGTHFWLAWDNKSFWKVALPLNIEPTAITAVNTRFGKDSPVLIGGRDGYIRAYRDALLTDDGTALASYVYIGPILSQKGGELQCVLNELTAILSTSSGSVRWDLYVGNSAEEAYNSSSVANGDFTIAGQNKTFRPRRRAGAFYLKLSNVDNLKPWALEKVSGTLETLNRMRLS